jgi:exonuclease SbcC
LNEKLVDLPKVKLTQENLPELESALEALRQEKAKAMEERQARAEALNAEVFAIEERMKLAVVDNSISEKHESLKQRLGALEGKIETARKKDGEGRKTLGVVEEKLRNIERAKQTLAELELRIEHLNGEISEWALLKKAFGMDGIIPLEIADAGPAIATIANELLLAFGGRYSVRIDTQLATANAKSLKEGFDIIVLDALINEEKSLSRLSGGQKTWVEDAITKAICIFNSQKHGKSYRTLFTDEKDGALDAVKKREYFQMKREVLRLGGYEREYCITHTPELLAQADAVIMIRDGSIEVSTEPLSIKPDLFQAA